MLGRFKNMAYEKVFKIVNNNRHLYLTFLGLLNNKKI